ncbi:MAG: adenylosuccinate lyase [bacterium]
MIPRYTRPELGQIWSDQGKYERWLRVELASLDVLAERGDVPARAVATIRRKARVDPARIEAIEAEVAHDVIAFVTQVAETVGPEGRFIHHGLTSSDVVDTAFALQLVEALEHVLAALDGMIAVLEQLATTHAATVMVGRTHGVHAEPITFGLKCALWYAEMVRNRARIERAREGVRVGKLSGAVGTFAHNPPAVEKAVLARLGLEPEPAANQVVQRDRHAELFCALAVLAGSMEKIAIEVRHLQRTEVAEAFEPFGKQQKGSSAMPHKRNPILAENLTGLARVVRAAAGAALEDIALWHERDISHSSVERVIGPDATIATHFMLVRLTGLLRGLDVRPQRMRANLEHGGGLVFSGEVLLKLVEAGLKREDAYKIVQRCAMTAVNEDRSFRALLEAEQEVARRLDAKTLDRAFDLDKQLTHVGFLIRRALATGKRPKPASRRRKEKGR